MFPIWLRNISSLWEETEESIQSEIYLINCLLEPKVVLSPFTPPFCDAALHWVIELTRWRSLAGASMQSAGDVSVMMSEGTASSSGAELAARLDTAAVAAAARQFSRRHKPRFISTLKQRKTQQLCVFAACFSPTKMAKTSLTEGMTECGCARECE